MSDYSAEAIEVHPEFDMELIMRISQESRMGGAILERLTDLFTQWAPTLQARRITAGKISYLVVWLGQEVEDAIDAAWATSPSSAFMDNALAQSLCMGAVHEVLPQIEDAGCAPAPRPTAALRAALEAEGLPYKDDGPALSRRYAVITHYPFKGACEICHLQAQCPKGQGQSDSASVVLPGYEQ